MNSLIPSAAEDAALDEAINRFYAYMAHHPKEIPVVEEIFRRIFGPDPFSVLEDANAPHETQIEGGR